MTRDDNHRVAGAHFARRFGRWPVPAADADALVNDVIFDRMIDPCWSPLERAFVDKERAKREARRLMPTLRLPETLAVIAMDDIDSPDALYAALRPFAGMPAVAKPTHASGGVCFLRDLAGPADVRILYELGCVDYATMLREMQYWQLPRKVIVETLVPGATAAPPDDYKFHCVHGEPLICQIDHNRFGAGWSRLFGVAPFAPLDEEDGLTAPDSFVAPSAERFAAMIAVARALAAPFAFVRVDLYNGVDGVYFGELTFTPAASLGIAPSVDGDHRLNATHRLYSRIMLTALTRAAPVVPA